jgi:hypothetical protein
VPPYVSLYSSLQTGKEPGSPPDLIIQWLGSEQKVCPQSQPQSAQQPARMQRKGTSRGESRTKWTFGTELAPSTRRDPGPAELATISPFHLCPGVIPSGCVPAEIAQSELCNRRRVGRHLTLPASPFTASQRLLRVRRKSRNFCNDGSRASDSRRRLLTGFTVTPRQNRHAILQVLLWTSPMRNNIQKRSSGSPIPIKHGSRD